MKLGLVTYMWGADWDVPTLIKNCEATGFEGVELRSTHKHGVEPTLNAAERREIKQRFADSKVVCVGLGSACEYHDPDHGIVLQNVELTKKFVELSRDVGGSGVKVRPNKLVTGEDRQRTVARIAEALVECGKFAAEHGQEIRVEVHGTGTSQPQVIREIMDAAQHPQVKVCWNSNPGETINGSLKHNFDLLKSRFGQTVHMHDLYDPEYPYRELAGLLHGMNYKGYCLSESPPTTDPLRVMRYYKALWDEFIRP